MDCAVRQRAFGLILTSGRGGSGRAFAGRGARLQARPKPATAAGAEAPAEKFTADQKEHWSYQPLERPEPPAVRELALGPQPDRPVHPGRAREHRASPCARGRSRRPDPPRHLRPDRPAADAARGRRVPGRSAGPTPTSGWSIACWPSPHYGERWAQHWLDLAHYADSNGFELDAERPDAWRYRDWVVRALNADLPYDRFVALQLAGDELEPGDPDGPDRHRLRPLRPARGRRRQRHPGGQAAERAHRDHRHGRLGLPRPDDRLRPLPRPQVRRDSRDRLLPAPGVLRGVGAGRRADRRQGRARGLRGGQEGGRAEGGPAPRAARRARGPVSQGAGRRGSTPC